MEINRNNYETYFLLCLDGELNPADRQSVEKFLSENADLQKEFSLLQQTVFSPPDLVFEHKETLFRKEEKRRIVPLYWTRIAAAATVLLLLGTWYMVSKSNQQGEPLIVPDSLVASHPAAKKNLLEIGKDSNRSITTTTGKDLAAEKNTGSGLKAEKESTNMSIPVRTTNQNTLVNPGKKNISAKGNVIQPGVLQNEVPLTDTQIAQTHTASDGDLVGVQKSSTDLQIQSAGLQNTGTTKQTPALEDVKSPALMLSASATRDQRMYEYAVIKESDYENDNAISVVALNDQNKGIAGFFKKITKRAPADDNSRKVRVSVFQFSY